MTTKTTPKNNDNNNRDRRSEGMAIMAVVDKCTVFEMHSIRNWNTTEILSHWTRFVPQFRFYLLFVSLSGYPRLKIDEKKSVHSEEPLAFASRCVLCLFFCDFRFGMQGRSRNTGRLGDRVAGPLPLSGARWIEALPAVGWHFLLTVTIGGGDVAPSLLDSRNRSDLNGTPLQAHVCFQSLPASASWRRRRSQLTAISVSVSFSLSDVFGNFQLPVYSRACVSFCYPFFQEKPLAEREWAEGALPLRHFSPSK